MIQPIDHSMKYYFTLTYAFMFDIFVLKNEQLGFVINR